MPQLDSTPVNLGHGVTARSFGVDGQIDRTRQAMRAGVPLPSAAPEQVLTEAHLPANAAARLGSCLAAADMRLHKVIAAHSLVPHWPTDGAQRPRLEVDVDAPTRDDERQVLLEVDHNGMLRWHLPVADGPGAGGQAGQPRQRFRIPVGQRVPGTAAITSGQRGLLDLTIGKVLHVVRYPIRLAAGWAARNMVALWEQSHRPYRLYVTDPFGRPAREVDIHWLAAAAAPCLVLVHGTFSTGAAAFAELFADPTTFGTLYQRYDGQILVFDHPTLHESPADNAAWLLGLLPSGHNLTFDVITHSRGGLVGRQPAFLSAATLSVRNLIQVAAPNAGTPLCDRNRFGDLLNVTTSMVAMLPAPAVSTVLEAVLEVVKQIGCGALDGLPGLAAMDPNDNELNKLNQVTASCPVFGIGADYEPSPAASLADKALDLAVGLFFEQRNDLVVPTGSMFRAGSFKATSEYLVTAPPGPTDVAHSQYFATPSVRERIRTYLS